MSLVPRILILLLFLAGFQTGASPIPLQPWTLAAPPGDATLQSSGDALHVTVTQAVNPYWNIELTQTLPRTVPAGDILRLRFQARSPTRNPIRAILEQAAAPYATVLQRLPTLTPQWRTYTITDTLATGYGPSGLGLRFQMGQQAGTVEIKNVTLEDLGPDSAIAQAKAAVQPAAIQARIRRYRMSDLTVLVRDAHGHPVPGARVQILMTRQAFLFGCNIFGLNPQDTSPLQLAYQQQFAALFNYATLPFYWSAFEPQPGQPQYARLDAMAHWCVAHGITPKAHPLVWHQAVPGWVPTRPDAVIPLLHKRVTDIVTHYRGLIHYYDVVNEANSPDITTGEGAWIQRDGAATVVATALGWARAAGRGAHDTFIYNDYNTGSQNVALLTQLQKRHALPDAIGIQSHMHTGVWPMTRVWMVCQRFARFGLPIHFTETTVLSGPTRSNFDTNKTYTDWVTTPAGEAAQANYVVQFYTLLFSHPNVRAITWWDFSDLHSWMGAPSGMLRKDMTPKPVYTRLMTLIHHTWWTDATGRTDKAGRDTIHAFYGDYRITVTDTHGHTVTQTLIWPEDSGPRRVIVTLR